MMSSDENSSEENTGVGGASGGKRPVSTVRLINTKSHITAVSSDIW